jgi:hypothetical protein
MSATNEEASPRCPWCSTPAGEGQTHCTACGANLAQRESIGDLVIPGVTHVDPGLSQYAKDPLRIPGASPTQYVAGPAVGAAVIAGGPAGLVALAGLGAVAATEYLGAGRGQSMTEQDLEKLGQPSEAVLRVAQRLDGKTEAADGATAGDGASDSPAGNPATDDLTPEDRPPQAS